MSHNWHKGLGLEYTNERGCTHAQARTYNLHMLICTLKSVLIYHKMPNARECEYFLQVNYKIVAFCISIFADINKY